MMRRFLILLLLAVSLSQSAFSRTRMREMIMNMPDSVLPLLTQVNRVDCIDFCEAGMQARVTNRMQGTTELEALSDVYAKWQYTTASTVEMRLLPVEDSTFVLCVVHTVLLPVADSRVCFYDESWAPLSANDFISLPSEAERWTATEISLSADEDALSVTLRSETYVQGGDEEASVTASSSSYVYVWEEGKFVPRTQFSPQTPG